ncbi:MAG: FAD-dependent oxidoreductase [Cyanobacteria bacterium]|nr:FAD-dependent oxidoreductase [Cyanobacteriota bacterium]
MSASGTDRSQTPSSRSVIVVGGGIVGVASAWLLQRRGHRVLLIDPALGSDSSAETAPSASRAALGVLMGHVFRRSHGRGWQLRQRSLALWKSWSHSLASRGRPIAYRSGLLLLAHDGPELERQQTLLAERQKLGLPFSAWSLEQLQAIAPPLPAPALGGLFSAADGQIDPHQALEALHSDACAAGLTSLPQSVTTIEPRRRGNGWQVRLLDGSVLEAEWLVLAAGIEGQSLLAALESQGARGAAVRAGPPLKLEPVLGQALELEVEASVAQAIGQPPPHQNDSDTIPGWPGVVVWQGMCLVPRPDLPGGRRLWLGSSLEPGREPDPAALQSLRDLGGAAPDWLLRARVVRQWQGLRPRPFGRPAPLLECLAPGLLLASGHYRNGVLLAPASAEWVCTQVESSL